MLAADETKFFAGWAPSITAWKPNQARGWQTRGANGSRNVRKAATWPEQFVSNRVTLTKWLGSGRRKVGLWLGDKRTWHDITGVHGILVLDEAESDHQLDFDDLAGAMFLKVRSDFFLGHCREREAEGRAPSLGLVADIEKPGLGAGSTEAQPCELVYEDGGRTVFGQVAQIEPRRRHVRHLESGIRTSRRILAVVLSILMELWGWLVPCWWWM